MFSIPLNSCQIQLEIAIASPTLIAGMKTDKSRAGAEPIRFARDGSGRIFIPASTLKGVFRTHAERICRTIESTPIPLCCDPFAVGQRSGFNVPCHVRLRGCSPQQRYRYSCPVCRIFGNQLLGGRLSFFDSYIMHDLAVSSSSLEIRSGLAQDRFMGSGVPVSAQKMESLSNKVFEMTLQIDNFEIWQLGLMYLILQSIDDGQIQIGRGRSRGMGVLTGHIREVRLTRFGRSNFAGVDFGYTIEGIGALFPDKENRWGFEPKASITGVRAFKQGQTEESVGAQTVIIRRAESIEQFFGKAASAWWHRNPDGTNTGFAVFAQSLREEAVALSSKEV